MISIYERLVKLFIIIYVAFNVSALNACPFKKRTNETLLAKSTSLALSCSFFIIIIFQVQMNNNESSNLNINTISYIIIYDLGFEKLFTIFIIYVKILTLSIV